MRLAPFEVAGTAPRLHEFPYLIGNDIRKCGRGDEFNPAAFSPHGGVSAQQNSHSRNGDPAPARWSRHSQLSEASGV
jgi:hypothetical protein